MKVCTKIASHTLIATALATTLASNRVQAQDMLNLSIEQLMGMDVVITSATKSQQKAIDAPAAVFVITHKDIRRAGISSIPEALRMVPGLHVAQISSNEWAVASRGLNGRLSRQLLILIDGRSIYTALFSGVNWDEQNLILDDIERIEVIRGPGGSLWGANAINGVINIISHPPNYKDGQRLTLRAGRGEKALVSGSHSGKLGDHGNYRLAAQHTELEGLYSPDLNTREKNWDHSRLSFNSNWQNNTDHFDVQVSAGRIITHSLWPIFDPLQPNLPHQAPREEKTNYNLQLAWQRQLSPRSLLKIRSSHDNFERRSTLYRWDTSNTDFESSLIHNFDAGHQLNLGFNYRGSYNQSKPAPETGLILNPANDHTEIYSLYGQYQYALSDNVQITAGAKAEAYSETHSSVQPTLRAIWSITPSQRLWAAVSKAVGTPSLMVSNASAGLETLAADELTHEQQTQLTALGLGGLPLATRIHSNDSTLKNTELTSLELGYRFRDNEDFNLDLTLFHHDYTHLLRAIPSSMEAVPSVSPKYVNHSFTYGDNGKATSHGIEFSAFWRVNPQWQLQYSASYLNFDSKANIDISITTISEDTPGTQHSLRSHFTPSSTTSIDLWLYHYGEMKDSNIDAFTSANVRVEWRPTSNMSIAVVGKNLLDQNRTEFFREALLVSTFEQQESYYLELQWRFN